VRRQLKGWFEPITKHVTLIIIKKLLSFKSFWNEDLYDSLFCSAVGDTGVGGFSGNYITNSVRTAKDMIASI